MNGADSVRIRTAVDADLQFLHRMLYEAANRPGDEWPPFDESINESRSRRFWSRWRRPGDIGCIAEADVDPVGAAWLRALEPAERSPVDHDDAVVLAIGIEGPYRGQGIGHRLLAHLIEQARAEGVRAIQLISGLFTEPAVRLYRRHGFVEMMRRGDGVHMCLELRVGA